MAEDPPKLRLVEPGERAPAVADPDPAASSAPAAEPGAVGEDAADRGTIAWMSAAVPLCIGIAVLVVGLAFAVRLLVDDGNAGADRDGDGEAVPTSPAAPTSSIDPLSLLPLTPTSVGETTSVPATTVPPTTVAPRNVDPALVPIPVSGGSAPSAPAPAAAVTSGTARIRIFNGFAPGGALDVWEMSGPEPAKYGTVPLGELREMVAGGRLLPSGVEVRLRFVRSGGDPRAVPDPSSGPWEWDFTPADGSSQTLMLSPNPGFRVVRIDNLRALGAAPVGRIHVVPVVFHLVLEGTRTKRWAADGVGCLGAVTTDNTEFDVAPGTAVRLASADDPTCGRSVTDAVVVTSPTAVAVVGIETGNDRARLVAVPLG